MPIDINSLFQDILETPEQRREKMLAQGAAQGQLATSNLTGLAASASPLIQAIYQNMPQQNEAMRTAVGGLLGKDLRTTSDKVQEAMSRFNPLDPQSVVSTTNMLRQMGMGTQAAQLAAMAAEERQKARAQELSERAMEQDIAASKAGVSRADEQEKRLAAQAQAEADYRKEMIDVDKRNADLREAEIGVRAEALQAERDALTNQDRRMIADATNASLENAGKARAMWDLAQRYSAYGQMGGSITSAQRTWRAFIGAQGGEDLLHTQYLGLKNKSVSDSLPKGAASDIDVAIFMQGWPNENADGDYISKFMRGQAKIAAIEAEKEKLKASYISQNRGNVAGFVEFWEARKNEDSFADEIERQYGVKFEEEDDAAEREALIRRLGGGQTEGARTRSRSNARPLNTR